VGTDEGDPCVVCGDGGLGVYGFGLFGGSLLCMTVIGSLRIVCKKCTWEEMLIGMLRVALCVVPVLV
jgi:hypothetical protein